MDHQKKLTSKKSHQCKNANQKTISSFFKKKGKNTIDCQNGDDATKKHDDDCVILKTISPQVLKDVGKCQSAPLGNSTVNSSAQKLLTINSKKIDAEVVLSDSSVPNLVKLTKYPSHTTERNDRLFLPPTPEAHMSKQPSKINVKRSKVSKLEMSVKLLTKTHSENTNISSKLESDRKGSSTQNLDVLPITPQTHSNKKSLKLSLKKNRLKTPNSTASSPKKVTLSLPIKRKNTFAEESKSKQINIDETDFKINSDDVLNEYLSYKFMDTVNGDIKLCLKDDVLQELTNVREKELLSKEDTEENLSDKFKDFEELRKMELDFEIVNTESKSEIIPTQETDSNDLFGSDIELEESLLEKNREVTSGFRKEEDVASIDFDESFSELAENQNVILIWIVSDILNNGMNEKVVKLESRRKKSLQAECVLKGDWYFMEIAVGDYAYVSGLSERNLQCMLDNNSPHYITLYPSTLISGTTIASGITCERQAIFNERFKMEYQNEAMILGSLVHDLFEWALGQKDITFSSLEKKAKELLQTRNVMDSLYQLDLPHEEIMKRMNEYFSSIENCFQSFFHNDKGKEIEFRLGTQSCNGMNDFDDNDQVQLVIDKVVDIEEMIWAPSYGFKGMIDVNVDVTIHKRRRNKIDTTKHMLPLELKTGKMWSKQGSLEHRAQLAVYSIMMSEKYKKDISTSLLYYIKANHMQGVPMLPQEKRAIIIKRNEIARKLTLEKVSTDLPDLLTNTRICKRCSQNKNCALYHKAIENRTSQPGALNELFEEITSHLTSQDYDFFKKWYMLIYEEVSYSKSSRGTAAIWESSSEELEKTGYCFSNMILNNAVDNVDNVYCFRRKMKHWNGWKSLKCFSIVVGDRIIVSVEGSRVFNISTGYILTIGDNEVKITLNRKVPESLYSKYFRIDKDSSVASLTAPFTNLAKLFSANDGYEEKLRRLIVQKETPWFLDVENNVLSHTVQELIKNLNEVQKKAIQRVLQAEDYLLILGMPGSGKSTTIATLVQVLVAMGKSVLLTSYTHSAVDTILIKLISSGFHDFIRLGQSSRVNIKLRNYTSDSRTAHFTDVSELTEFYTKQKVVATTSLSVNHALFKHKLFDYCIVDEASQITQPVCIGPITHAKTFILVGDHNQLPPLVQSDTARKNGLDVSLFNDLADCSPEAVVSLNYQYRMNKEIMSLANHLVYNSSMKCANDVIAESKLKLNNFDIDLKSDDSVKLLLNIIDPKTPVIFVNTDNKTLSETKYFAKIINNGEASLVASIVNQLLKHGLTPKDMGVITPYRHQIHVIRDELSLLCVNDDKLLEVDTVDKYQGKDKKCIIVSFVRSNSNNETGELLKDWRRINVAITRAKHKLILIGSKRTLSNAEFMNSLISIVEANGYLYNL